VLRVSQSHVGTALPLYFQLLGQKPITVTYAFPLGFGAGSRYSITSPFSTTRDACICLYMLVARGKCYLLPPPLLCLKPASKRDT
jgi:hypothetical protein